MTNVIDKHDLTRDQQAMLAIWQRRYPRQIRTQDADTALATMTENPYVFLVASGVGRVGRAAVHEFFTPISFCRTSPRISKSPPCRRPSAPIASSKKW